jgi:hypothetical protein
MNQLRAALQFSYALKKEIVGSCTINGEIIGQYIILGNEQTINISQEMKQLLKPINFHTHLPSSIGINPPSGEDIMLCIYNSLHKNNKWIEFVVTYEGVYTIECAAYTISGILMQNYDELIQWKEKIINEINKDIDNNAEQFVNEIFLPHIATKISLSKWDPIKLF